MARIAVGIGQVQCRLSANLRCDHDIGAYIEVVEDLLVPTACQFPHCDAGCSGVGASEWMTDVECVLLLCKAHGEESGGPMRSFVRWSVAICGQVPEKKVTASLGGAQCIWALVIANDPDTQPDSTFWTLVIRNDPESAAS
jgi:hypothetical protein